MESDRAIVSLPPHPQSAPPPSDGASHSFQRVRSLHGRTTGPTRRSTRGQWTPGEDEILCQAVQRYKGKNWKKIAECFKDRTDVQCLHRWQKVLNPDLIKGPWSKEEDDVIIELVNKYGPKKWSTIAQHLPGRIGKQCRERWHNHLNPGIKKDAWTQEEELILIHAHQIYGNKWAELTKVLPGRTDNAIKNHWNSSVKKKLESYRASGLLEQFQGFPAVSHQNQPFPPSSLRIQQSSGDDSFCRDGTEVEDNSECSQGSAFISCSQTASGDPPRQSSHCKEQSASPAASCTDQYLTSFEDVTFTVSDLPCEFSCSSGYLDDNILQEPRISTTGDCHSGAHDLPNMSSKLAPESSRLSEGYAGASEKNEMDSGCLQTCPEINASLAMGSDKAGCKLVNDNDSGGATFTMESSDICHSFENLGKFSGMIDFDRYISDAINFEPSGFPLSELGEYVAPQSHHSQGSDAVGTSRCQNFPSHLLHLSGDNASALDKNEPEQSCLVGSQGQELTGRAEDGIICLDPSDHIDVTGLTEQTDLVMDTSKLVSVDFFTSAPSDGQQACISEDEKLIIPPADQDIGALCYEPPRFPKVDIPFFSCDLAQSGMDVQQEYSPLGIRQLMMSSTSSLTPFKLWELPPSDGNPDALLESAARTFSCTPSILKKRHRDLLSPLSPFSERRFDKKCGNDFNQDVLCPSNLSKEFARLDVIFDEAAAQTNSLLSPSHNTEAAMEDKENIHPTHGDRVDGGNEVAVADDHASGENSLDGDQKKNVQMNGASETSRGVLLEHNMNMDSSSPDEFRLNERTSELNDRTTQDHSLEDTCKSGANSEPVTVNSGQVLSPTFVEGKSSHSLPASVLSNLSNSSEMVDDLVNEVGIENLNLFGGTPFRRGIESPSAWKSPWFFNSFVPGPRLDTNITIEDIGIFMSPGERSFDAIGLMRQINERSADAYADAREVLGNETPESILKGRCLKSLHPDGESNGSQHSQRDGRLRLASNVLAECRTLDFSECGAPEKSTDEGKYSSSIGLSSPSCSLLKSYR